MALVWSKQVSGVGYEVRSAGSSKRLYTDGVFHSQYNPKQLLTGHVWDLLMIPAFFYPQNTIKRVLVLGVGGGAVMHMLRYFISPDKILGIELNPIHISVARRFFNLKHKSFELIEADAITWLENYRGEQFDMIIDDLFAEQDGEPVSVVNANGRWFSCMLKQLNKNGVIVRNFVSKEELLDSAGISNQAISNRFACVFQLSNDLNENFVGVYSRADVNSNQLRKNLIKTPKLNPALKTSRLKYRIRKVI
ncbi:MAG: methyltransferase domain-containing protein [Gammaproteobacteria bacterium]|nr:methyltransferase domain-containing protein [Gammaproteobacteria bacterium]